MAFVPDGREGPSRDGAATGTAVEPEVESRSAPLPPDPHRALPAPGQESGATGSADPAAPGKSRGSWVRITLIALVILLAVGAVIWKIRANRQAQAAEAQKMVAAADRPVPVSVTPVQQRTMPIYLSALGTVTAYNSVTVRSRVDGQLLRVNFREGQSVRKGELLAEIDPRPYQAALGQAQGQLVKDQANAKNADAEAARYTALYQAGVVSRESQQSQVSTSGQAKGSIVADQAAIDAARVNLVYTRITSPIDGVVGLRQVDPGNIVHAADTTGLVLVTQLQPISVIFTLPEDYLPRVLPILRAGKQLVVEAYDRAETVHLGTGRLLTVDNQIDTTTGTAKVKAVFDNRDNALFPNQFVNVRLVLENRANSLVIPSAAVQTGTQGSYVYVVRDGNPPAALEQQHAASRAAGKGHAAAGANPNAGSGSPHYVVVQQIRIDLTEGTQTVVADGLKAGDQVVLDGTEKLRNGSRVLPHVQALPPGANPIATGNPPPAPTTAHDAKGPKSHTHASEPGLDEPARHPRRATATTDSSSIGGNTGSSSTQGSGQGAGQGTRP